MKTRPIACRIYEGKLMNSWYPSIVLYFTGLQYLFDIWHRHVCPDSIETE